MTLRSYVKVYRTFRRLSNWNGVIEIPDVQLRVIAGPWRHRGPSVGIILEMAVDDPFCLGFGDPVRVAPRDR